MSNYDQEALLQIAIEHADALCEHLDGDWRQTEVIESRVSIVRDGCELYLWGYEQHGTARLSIRAQLPDGWGAVEDATPPEITVRADRTIESIAADITRRLLPLHAETAARVNAALEQAERRQAASASIIDHFLQIMPGGVPDLRHPGTAVGSVGPGRFKANLLLSQDAQAADLLLLDCPIELARGIVMLAGRQLSQMTPAEGSPAQVLDELADAVTTLASVRAAIPVKRLLQETALNILILSRIASNRLQSPDDREEIESATDHLVSGLRHCARGLPDPPASDATPAGQ